ncbi:MAG: NADP-dependent oxidoreductase [Rhizobiales bacterium]|nr:NADP-dependent oxidoreductase [Hyphomicrobiales bacterium]
MRAYQFTGYGPTSSKVVLTDLAAPVAQRGEVLIEIHAASLNPIDYKIVRGDLKRVVSYKLPHRLGYDLSGVVTAVGEGVTRFKSGDEVYARTSGDSIGSFAQTIALNQDYVAMKPSNLPHDQAAALPLVGLTTVQGLVDRVHVKSGQSILIHAGSGGVGTFAVQYCKHLGMNVTATTSSRNAEFVKSLGADRVIAYDKENYLDAGQTYDVVYDTLGGAVTSDSFKVVKRGGVVLSLSGPPDRGFPERVGAGLVVRLAVWMMSRKVYAAAKQAGASYCWYLTEPSGRQLTDIAKIVESGAIKPVIDREFPFDRLLDALTHLQSGRARGKIVLKVR